MTGKLQLICKGDVVIDKNTGEEWTVWDGSVLSDFLEVRGYPNQSSAYLQKRIVKMSDFQTLFTYGKRNPIGEVVGGYNE